MAERMGGITRLFSRDNPNPDLLKDRLREQTENDSGAEEKPGGRKTMPSRLQRAIVNECLENGWETGSYSAPVETIIDVYYGKRSGIRTAKRVAVRRAIRTLDRKGLVKLMPGLCGRVELTESAIRIAKERRPQRSQGRNRRAWA